MFRNIFNPENALMTTIAQIGDCIFLSLFWVAGCIPFVTLGASTAALYDATYRSFRKGEKYSWQRFFYVFRNHLKAGILPSIVLIALFSALAYLLIQQWNNAVAGTLSWSVFSAFAFLGMIAFGVLSVMLPLLSRFETNFVTLLKNTVLLALANLPRTVALGILNTVVFFLCIMYVFPLFFLPSLAALIGSLFLEPMFKPYMPVIETVDDEAED